MTDLGRLRMLSRIAEELGEGVTVVDNEAGSIYANSALSTMHRCTPGQPDAAMRSAFYRPAEWNGSV